MGDLTTLRARSRDLRRNAPLATGALNTIVTSAVGTGLTPRARIDRELLGLTEEEAGAWEAHAARIWAWWAETPACDVTGRFDFATLQALVLVSSLESGDVLAIRRRKEGRARLLGLALQLLEADYLSKAYAGIAGRIKELGNIQAHTVTDGNVSRVEVLFAIRTAEGLLELVAGLLARRPQLGQ